MTEQQARDWSIRHAEEMERQRKDAERYRMIKRMTMQQLQMAHEQAARPARYGGSSFDAAIDEAMK